MLLFRFSALTFNSHLIHYDQDYARNVEHQPGKTRRVGKYGYRGSSLPLFCIDCLVHGPLSLVWMLNTLHRHLKKVDTNKYIESFEYRCHRPLVVRQPLVVGGKQRSDNFGDYDVWVLDAEGKVAVHGVAAVGFSL
jgi:3-methylfumaryl-CoA hydratase